MTAPCPIRSIFLTVATYVVVAVGGGCYIYGCIIKPRGSGAGMWLRMLLSHGGPGQPAGGLPARGRRGAVQQLHGPGVPSAARSAEAMVAFRGRAGDRRRAGTIEAAERASVRGPWCLPGNAAAFYWCYRHPVRIRT